MNLMPARVESHGSDATIHIDTAETSITLPAPANEGLIARAGSNVVFGIRPEALTHPEGADRTDGQLAEAICTIEVVEPAGSDTFAVMHLGGKEVTARLRADAAIKAGDRATLTFNMSKAVFFDPETEQRIA